MSRRCIACMGPLPTGALIICSPKCAKAARQQEAARLAAAEQVHHARGVAGSLERPSTKRRAAAGDAEHRDHNHHGVHQ